MLTAAVLKSKVAPKTAVALTSNALRGNSRFLSPPDTDAQAPCPNKWPMLKTSPSIG